MTSRDYADLSKEELIEQLKDRDRRFATRFGLVWEANDIDRDKALNNDFVSLDLVPELSTGPAPWRNLIIEGDNFDALRYLKMCFAGGHACRAASGRRSSTMRPNFFRALVRRDFATHPRIGDFAD